MCIYIIYIYTHTDIWYIYIYILRGYRPLPPTPEESRSGHHSWYFMIIYVIFLSTCVSAASHFLHNVALWTDKKPAPHCSLQASKTLASPQRLLPLAFFFPRWFLLLVACRCRQGSADTVWFMIYNVYGYTIQVSPTPEWTWKLQRFFDAVPGLGWRDG